MSNGSITTANVLEKVTERAKVAYQETFNFLCNLTGSNFVSMLIAAAVAGLVFSVGIIFQLILFIGTVIGLPFATAVIEGFGDIRKSGSPQLNELITAAMGEYLGVDVAPSELPLVAGANTTLERAKALGFKFQGLLRKEFGVLSKEVASDGSTHIFPDSTPAETFAGYAIDFAVFTAITGILGEIESLGRFQQFKDIGADITQNLSLGRLQRIAQQPLFKIAVADPLEWALNRQLRPTLLKEQEVINALHAGDVSPEDAFEELARKGYNTAKINSLISQYKQHVSVLGAERLWRWEVFSRGDAVIYLTKLGWAKEDAELALKDQELARLDAQENKDLELLRRHIVNGVLSEKQAEFALEGFHTTDEEKQDFLRRALFERDLPRKFLTEGNLIKAFEHGLIDVDEFDAENRRSGYSTDDQQILLLLALLALNKQREADKLKKQRDEKKKKKQAAPTGTP